MTRSRPPHIGASSQRTQVGRRSDGIRSWQCGPRRGRYAILPTVQLVVVAESRLATRLSPPYSSGQAAVLADAALSDTCQAVVAMPGAHRSPVTGRLDQAFAETRLFTGPSLLVGTETPQVSPGLLAESVALLGKFDAVLGPTTGDGWWAFGLREPADPAMPTPADTGSLVLAMLRLGMRVAMLPTLQQTNTVADAHAVAAGCQPGSRFAATVARLRPAGWQSR
jgi:glycosyltransferase A (GT-A) superfamily protein (DUF2064 family)